MVVKGVNGGVLGVGAPGPFNHLFSVEERADLSLLVAFGPGPAPDPTNITLIQSLLRTYLPEATVIEAALHDWATDEFSNGVWLVPAPGLITSTLPQLREPHGNVWFAGADFAMLSPGHIDGAIESGADAAAAVNMRLATGQRNQVRLEGNDVRR